MVHDHHRRVSDNDITAPAARLEKLRSMSSVETWLETDEEPVTLLFITGKSSRCNARKIYCDALKETRKLLTPTSTSRPVSAVPSSSRSNSWSCSSASTASCYSHSSDSVSHAYLPIPRCESPATELQEPDDDSVCRNNVFYTIDAAVFNEFLSDRRLAASIVRRLHQLPPGKRAQVYNFDTQFIACVDGSSELTSGDGDISTPSPVRAIAITTSGSNSSRYVRNKRPANSAGEAQPRRTRRRANFTFACPFNIFKPDKFCIQYGAQGHDRFKSCAGPGWTEVRRLVDHFRDVHLRPQCTRCYKIFDKEKDLETHKDQEPRVDCPDLREEVHRIESMSEGTFREVKDILSTKRGATDEQRKEEPKWFKVKNLIFPPTIYPDFPDPETPYYQNPKLETEDAGAPKLERFKSFLQTIWDSNANEALKGNIICSVSDFRVSWEEFEDMFDKAIALCTKTQSRPQPLSENVPLCESRIVMKQKGVHERENNGQQGLEINGHGESQDSNGIDSADSADGEQTDYMFEWDVDMNNMLRNVGDNFNSPFNV